MILTKVCTLIKLTVRVTLTTHNKLECLSNQGNQQMIESNWMLRFRRLGQEDDDDINMDDTVEDEEPEEAETDPLLLATQQKLAEKLVEEQTKMLIAYFLFSIVWSVAATLDSPSKLKFDEFLRLQCASEGEHHAKQPR